MNSWPQVVAACMQMVAVVFLSCARVNVVLAVPPIPAKNTIASVVVHCFEASSVILAWKTVALVYIYITVPTKAEKALILVLGYVVILTPTVCETRQASAGILVVGNRRVSCRVGAYTTVDTREARAFVHVNITMATQMNHTLLSECGYSAVRTHAVGKAVYAATGICVMWDRVVHRRL